MLQMLFENAPNGVTVNGNVYDSVDELLDNINSLDHLLLIQINNSDTINPISVSQPTQEVPTISYTELNDSTIYRITVKPYMIRPSTPSFDFHKRWNNDVPMPFQVMKGVKLRESKGMVYMNLCGLHSDTTWEGWLPKSSIIICEPNG